MLKLTLVIQVSMQCNNVTLPFSKVKLVTEKLPRTVMENLPMKSGRIRLGPLLLSGDNRYLWQGLYLPCGSVVDQKSNSQFGNAPSLAMLLTVVRCGH